MPSPKGKAGFSLSGEAGHQHCPFSTVNCPLKKAPLLKRCFFALRFRALSHFAEEIDVRRNGVVDALDLLRGDLPVECAAVLDRFGSGTHAAKCGGDVVVAGLPVDRDLDRRTADFLADLFEHVDKLQDLAELRLTEERIETASRITRLEGRLLAERAGEDACAHGTIGEGADAAGNGPLQKLFLIAHDHGIRRLERVNLDDLLALEKLLAVEVGQADEADLALLLQGLHGFHRLGERGVGIRPMDKVEVDVIGAEAAQRLLAFVQDVFIASVAAVAAAGADGLHRAGRSADLGGKEDLGAVEALEGFAGHDFGMAVAVVRRGVDAVDAMIEHGMECLDAVLLGDGAVAAVACRPAADGDGGNVYIGISQVFITHTLFLLKKLRAARILIVYSIAESVGKNKFDFKYCTKIKTGLPAFSREKPCAADFVLESAAFYKFCLTFPLRT